MTLTRSASASTRSSTAPLQTSIDIGARRTIVVVRRGTATEAALELPVGARQAAEKFSWHDPPRPAELEAAIDAIEDQVMRLSGRLPAESPLRVTGPFAAEIGRAVNANDDANPVAGLDEVEQVFQRLASASLGNPAARQGLPSGNSFVAAVLILREFMHHLGFASVVLRPDAGRP